MIEYRSASGVAGASGDTLTGLVTPFNVDTNIGDPERGGFTERIAPGAFTKTLQDRDVVLVNSHAPHMPLARTSITSGPGSLTLREDPASGLHMDAEPVKTSYGDDVLKLTRAGVIKGMSFGFEVVRDSWTDDHGRSALPSTGTHRTIHEIRLHECTTTAFPAYPTTTLDARDTVNAARGVSETRAAKASYADLDTCGECGSAGQYGSFCGDCGEPMKQPAPKNAFCTSCGQKLDAGKRSEHRCEVSDSEARDSALDELHDSDVSVAAELEAAILTDEMSI